MGEIVELIALLEVTQRGALAGDSFNRGLIGAVCKQPKVSAKERVIILEGEALQIVTGSTAEPRAHEVGVIEFVIADADVNLRRTETVVLPREKRA